MSHPQLTEERLRTWLLTQADREQMCLAVLAMNPRYSDLQPRRPKGGPDGARDIEHSTMATRSGGRWVPQQRLRFSRGPQVSPEEIR